MKPFERSSALVTDGVFGLSRNPMYLGMVLIAAGVACVLGSLSPWFVVPALGVLLDRLFIAPEERILRETFGPTFDGYQRRVRRWL